jgi:hypothetical protein
MLLRYVPQPTPALKDGRHQQQTRRLVWGILFVFVGCFVYGMALFARTEVWRQRKLAPRKEWGWAIKSHDLSDTPFHHRIEFGVSKTKPAQSRLSPTPFTTAGFEPAVSAPTPNSIRW